MGSCTSAPKKPYPGAGRRLPAPDQDAKYVPAYREPQQQPVSVAAEEPNEEEFVSSVHSAHEHNATTSSPQQNTVTREWQWKKGAQLGKGAYGVVHIAHLMDTGQLVAVKQVEQLNSTDASTRHKVAACVRELEGEIRTLQKLKHPNIVQYLGFERTDTHFNIFLEWVPGGSIRKLLDDFGPLEEQCVRIYTKEVLQGLRYLHRRKIMHRDIKGQNVLVDTVGNIKLTDFGASKQIHTVALSAREDNQQMSLKGTLYWMAPEMMQGKDVGMPADIWSLGCLVVEMITAQAPWHDQLDKKLKNNMMGIIYHIVNNDIQPAIPENLSKDGKEFLKLCFDRDPRRRANCNRLLEHPFVANVNTPASAHQLATYTDVGNTFSPIHEESSGLATPPSNPPQSSSTQAGRPPRSTPQRLVSERSRPTYTEDVLIQPALGPGPGKEPERTPNPTPSELPQRPSTAHATGDRPSRVTGAYDHVSASDAVGSFSGRRPGSAGPGSEHETFDRPADIHGKDSMISPLPYERNDRHHHAGPVHTPMDDSIVITDEPTMDHSPEFAHVSPRPAQEHTSAAPAVAHSMLSFNPMQSFAEDCLHDSIFKGSAPDPQPATVSPVRIAVPDTIEEENTEASSENVSHNAQPASGELTPRDRPIESETHSQMDIYAMKNPLFGTQNSVNVSHTGFAHQLADAANMGRPETGRALGGLAPISEGATGNLKSGRIEYERSRDELPESGGSKTPRATWKERPWVGRVLPPMHDPSRPSTGQPGRVRASQAPSPQRSRMSAGDLDSTMEKLLCEARQSRQSYIHPMRNRPSTAAAYMGNIQM